MADRRTLADPRDDKAGVDALDQVGEVGVVVRVLANEGVLDGADRSVGNDGREYPRS